MGGVARSEVWVGLQGVKWHLMVGLPMGEYAKPIERIPENTRASAIGGVSIGTTGTSGCLWACGCIGWG